MNQSGGRRLLAVILLPLLLLGCSANLKHASCGWANEIPANGTQVCNAAYETLRAIARAEARDEPKTIRRLVSAARVAQRIIRFGRSLRAQGLQYLRTTPLLVLTARPHNRAIVSAYIVGRTSSGKINSQEVVIVHVHDGRAIVVGDQPNQDW